MSRPIAKWNYEQCQAQAGTAIVGKCENPTYWHAGLEGQRRRVVRVDYKGDVFFIDDEDSSGSRKVFVAGGGPGSSHKSIPIDDPSTFRRWKPMEVAFGDNLLRPRRLILEITLGGYSVTGQSGGVGYLHESSLRTLEDWLIWIDHFSDDLTGRELREAKEAAKAPFIEPKYWTDFRERYARTGDPFLKAGAQ